MQEYWSMTLKEYVYKIEGYVKATNDRRMELKTLLYPIYRCVLAALGKGNTPMSFDDYLPTGPVEKKEALTDPNGLLKKRFERNNPHVKLKDYYGKRRTGNISKR